MAKLDKEIQEAAAASEVDTVPEPSTDVAEKKIPMSSFDVLHKAIQEVAEKGEDSDAAVMDRIIGSILTAESMDDVLDLNTPLKAAEVLGEQLVVRDITFTESDIEDARIPYYATLHCTRSEKNQPAVVNVGGEQVLAQALWLTSHATFPLVMRIVEVGKEKAGRSRPLRLTWAVNPNGPGY